MKYYTVHIRGDDKRSFYYHTYDKNANAATAKALRETIREHPSVDKLEIISTLERGFDVGDRVVVSDHPVIEDKPGTVIGHEEDGWVIVEWEELNYSEEFHWTELEKADE